MGGKAIDKHRSRASSLSRAHPDAVRRLERKALPRLADGDELEALRAA